MEGVGFCCTCTIKVLSPEGAAIACRKSSEGRKQLVILQSEQEQKVWQLIALTESYAEEKLAKLLLAGQWEASLLLAEAHSLNKDLIHKLVPFPWPLLVLCPVGIIR